MFKRFYVKKNEEKVFKQARKGKGGFAFLRSSWKNGRSGAVPVPACVFIMTMGLALVFAACGAAEGGKTAAPKANPPPGYVALGMAVKLVSRTPGAQIYSTTSTGVPPTLVEGNPVITQDTTILAFAREEGYEDSDEVSFEYRVDSVTIEELESYLRGRGPTTRTLSTPSAWRREPPSPAAPWGLSTTPSGTRESSSTSTSQATAPRGTG